MDFYFVELTLFDKELQEYFSEERMQELEKEPGYYKKTVEKEHGGIVTREYYQTDETRWYEDKKKWKGLATFGMVKKKLEKPDGKTIEERRYYISSLPVDVELFSKAARGTGEWRTSSTGIWILHLRMITIQQQKKHVLKTCRC